MVNEKGRDYTIDLVKMIAILGVIVIHVGSSILTYEPVGSFEWMSGLFWGSLFRASVPLFLMASGAIMLEPRKTLSIKKLYFHNIARIVVAMLVWGFAYKIYHLIDEGHLNLSMIWYSFKRLLLFDQEFHFYYIHMILIVYIFLPVTRLFAEKAERRQLEYGLSVWLVLGVIYPTFRTFWPFNLLSGLTGQWEINLVFSSIGYGLLGYYLKKYPLPLKMGISCSAIGFLIAFGMTFFLSKQLSYLNELFLQGTSIGVCLLAAGIFSVSPFIKLNNIAEKVVVFFSKASFCIYLAHMFILYELAHWGIVASMMPAIYSIPLISVFAISICLILYMIIRKIPLVNKWII